MKQEEKKFRILVVGDVLVDRYVYVETSRNASEAKIPVWDEVSHETRPGGAANVALNLAAIGGSEVEVYIAGICDDEAVRMTLELAGVRQHLLNGSDTLMKTRYVRKGSVQSAVDYLFRTDNKRKFDPYDVESFGDLFTTIAANKMDQYDAIIISDYDKGTITPVVCDLIKKTSRFRDCPVIVDSKRADLRIFAGMKVMKLNHEEYSKQVSSKDYPCVERFFECVIVTKGAGGCELRQCEIEGSTDRKFVVHSENFLVDKQKAVDVTGCGDTHTAALAFGLVKTRDMRFAVRLANVCAASVVKKFGTSVADKGE